MFVVFNSVAKGHKRIAIPTGCIVEVQESNEATHIYTEYPNGTGRSYIVAHSFDEVGSLITTAFTRRHDRSPLLTVDSDEVQFLKRIKHLLETERGNEALNMINSVIPSTQGEDDTNDTDTDAK